MTADNCQTNAAAELAKAQAALKAARTLRDAGLFDDAASRAYYAAFHLISAALLCLGVQAGSHNGVAALLGQHLVKPGLLPPELSKEFALLLGLRNQADYNRFFNLTEAAFTTELARVEGVFAVVLPFLAARGVQ